MLLFFSKELRRSSRIIPLYWAYDSILLIYVLNAAVTPYEIIFLLIAVGLVVILRSVKLVFCSVCFVKVSVIVIYLNGFMIPFL